MDNMAELLSALAVKLGTTTEHLWRVLLKQAPIDGLVTLVQCIILVFVAVWFAKFTVAIKKAIDDGSRDEVWWCVPIMGWVILSTLLIALFFLLPDVAASFINPEYWALEHLLNKIATIK